MCCNSVNSGWRRCARWRSSITLRPSQSNLQTEGSDGGGGGGTSEKFSFLNIVLQLASSSLEEQHFLLSAISEYWIFMSSCLWALIGCRFCRYYLVLVFTMLCRKKNGGVSRRKASAFFLWLAEMCTQKVNIYDKNLAFWCRFSASWINALLTCQTIKFGETYCSN